LKCGRKENLSCKTQTENKKGLLTQTVARDSAPGES